MKLLLKDTRTSFHPYSGQSGLINLVTGHAEKIYQHRIKDVYELNELILAARDQMDRQFIDTAVKQFISLVSKRVSMQKAASSNTFYFWLCLCLTKLTTTFCFAVGAVAKYCDEHACVRVCLSACEDISRTTRAIFAKFLCMLPMARSSSGRMTKSRGQGAVLGVFFPNDNAMYSIAFGIRTKTAEPIQIPFGMMSGPGPRNNVLRGGDDSRRGRGSFGGKACPTSINTPMNCELDWSMQRRAHDKGQTLDCKRQTSLLSARRGVRLHTADEVWYPRLPSFSNCFSLRQN